MQEMIDFLEALTGVTQAFVTCLWPLIVIVVLAVLFKDIRTLLPRIQSAEVPGFKFELTALNQSAMESAAEMAALPQPPPRVVTADVEIEKEEVSQDIDPIDVEREILTVAANSPRAGLMLLASEIEKEIRTLVGSLGLTNEQKYSTPQQGFELVRKSRGLPESLSESLGLFWKLRNQLIHGQGQDLDDKSVLRAIDSGIVILRTLKAAARQSSYVYHPDVPVYADEKGQQERPSVKGVILESVSAGGTRKALKIYPTTRTDYKKGEQVAWEWNRKNGYGESWYKDPDTGEIKYAWTDSFEFVGRHIKDL